MVLLYLNYGCNKIELNNELVICLLGYILAIFFSGIGLIYGLILYLLKKDNEMYYEHSRNIMAFAIIFIVIRIFTSFGTLIFGSLY